MIKYSQVILICEDRQHSAFARRFLKKMGDPRIVRSLISPSGVGSAERWVHECYVTEVKAHRQASYIKDRALLVVIDEDTQSTKPRAKSLADALVAEGVAPRGKDEAIMLAIPERNIETWLAYLEGADVDPTRSYPKRKRQRECQPMVDALQEMCDRGALREPAPPSLKTACVEFTRIS